MASGSGLNVEIYAVCEGHKILSGQREDARHAAVIAMLRTLPRRRRYGVVARYCGGRRALVACSNAYASLRSVGSLQARPMNVSPTGSPSTWPAGTLTSG